MSVLTENREVTAVNWHNIASSEARFAHERRVSVINSVEQRAIAKARAKCAAAIAKAKLAASEARCASALQRDQDIATARQEKAVEAPRAVEAPVAAADPVEVYKAEKARLEAVCGEAVRDAMAGLDDLYGAEYEAADERARAAVAEAHERRDAGIAEAFRVMRAAR